MSYNSYRYDESGSQLRSTRWADEQELRERLVKIDLTAEHYPTAGLPLISDGKTAYVNADDSHALIVGATGSKKTRLIGMPMMEMFARAGESVVCTDPKGELYQRTSGLYEREGYDIKVINLRNPLQSDGWNPLYLAAKMRKEGKLDQAVGIINDLAATFFPMKDGRNIDPFWIQISRTLFQGLCEMVLEREDAYPEVSLRTVQALSEGLGENYYINTRTLLEKYPEDSLARQNVITAISGSEKTTDNVIISYKAGVQFLYSQKSLLDLLSVQGVDFSTIGTRKTAVYVIMPDEKTTFHPIVSLLIKQCYERLIAIAQESMGMSLPVRVNFLLDEFSSLPTIPDMSSMISAARSRNIRFYLIIQSLNQLKSKYGVDADTIRGNCNDWVFLTSREVELLEELERLCGMDTRDQRPLISISQLQRLDKQRGEVLLLCGRLYPYIGNLADIDEYPFAHLPPRELPNLRAETFDISATKQAAVKLVNPPGDGANYYSMDTLVEAWHDSRHGRHVLFRFGKAGRKPLIWIARALPEKKLELFCTSIFPLPNISLMDLTTGLFEKYGLQRFSHYLFDPREYQQLAPMELTDGVKGDTLVYLSLPSGEELKEMFSTPEKWDLLHPLDDAEMKDGMGIVTADGKLLKEIRGMHYPRLTEIGYLHPLYGFIPRIQVSLYPDEGYSEARMTKLTRRNVEEYLASEAAEGETDEERSAAALLAGEPDERAEEDLQDQLDQMFYKFFGNH